MLVELAQLYSAAINKGSIPSIESAWNNVCSSECERAIKESMGHYDRLTQGIDADSLESLKVMLDQIKEKTKDKFKSIAIGGNADTEMFLEKLVGEVRTRNAVLEK